MKILYSPQENSRFVCIFHKKYRFFDSSVTEEFCINVVILRLVSIFILVEVCNIFPEQPILCEHKILCKYNGISHLCEDALQPPLYCCQNQHLLDDLTNQHLLDDLTALSQLLTHTWPHPLCHKIFGAYAQSLKKFDRILDVLTPFLT